MNAQWIKSLLQGYLSYYRSSRAVGHTHAMLHGAISTNANVVVAGKRDAVSMKLAGFNGTCLPFRSDPDKLRGFRGPLSWDNHALEWLFQGCLARIEELEAENVKLKTNSGSHQFPDRIIYY